MHWSGVNEEIHHILMMGGYAKFIWTAYGIAFAVLFCNLYLPWRQNKKIKEKISCIHYEKDA